MLIKVQPLTGKNALENDICIIAAIMFQRQCLRVSQVRYMLLTKHVS